MLEGRLGAHQQAKIGRLGPAGGGALLASGKDSPESQSQFLLWLVSQEIVDYEKEEEIAGVTDLPEQSAADPSCTRTLSCRA